MAEKKISSLFLKTLGDPTQNRHHPPRGNDVEIALMIFSGASLGEIRSRFAGIRIVQVGDALRRVRDEIRIGEAPPEIAEKFPDIVNFQRKLQEDANKAKEELGPKPVSEETNWHFAKVLDITRSLVPGPTPATFRKFIDKQRAALARFMVPMAFEQLAKATAAGNFEAVKLNSDIFGLIPEKPQSRGMQLNQQFKFGDKPQQNALPPPPDRGLNFEKLLRTAREQDSTGNVITIESRPQPLPDFEPKSADEDEDD